MTALLAGAQGNAQMVPKIIERGVRSLENNQAVIDREAWFKARLLLSGLTPHLVATVGSMCLCGRWRTAAPTCGGRVRVARSCPGSILPQPTAAGRVLAPYAQAQGGNARKTHNCVTRRTVTGRCFSHVRSRPAHLVIAQPHICVVCQLHLVGIPAKGPRYALGTFRPAMVP